MGIVYGIVCECLREDIVPACGVKSVSYGLCNVRNCVRMVTVWRHEMYKVIYG